VFDSFLAFFSFFFFSFFQHLRLSLVVFTNKETSKYTPFNELNMTLGINSKGNLTT